METPSQRPPERLRMESNTAHAANVYQLSPCGGSGGMQKTNSSKQHIDLALAEPIVQRELVVTNRELLSIVPGTLGNLEQGSLGTTGREEGWRGESGEESA